MCGERAPVRAKVHHEINNIENPTSGRGLTSGNEMAKHSKRNHPMIIMMFLENNQDVTSKSRPGSVLGGEVGATLDRSKGDHFCRSYLGTKTIGPEHSILLIL